ncbi:hypothetical protein ACE6H2_003508 [Prunus campanulata]
MSLLFSLTISLCFMCSTFSDFLFLCSRLLYFFLMTVGPRFLSYGRLLSLRTSINLAWDNIPLCHRKYAVIIWKKTCN